MTTNSRDLRERVTVLTSTPTTDAQLGRSRAPVTFATIWAAVRATGAAETKENERVTSVTSYEVETRYRTDLTTTMQLRWTPYGGSAKTLAILGIRIKPGRPERVLLDCQEAA